MTAPVPTMLVTAEALERLPSGSGRRELVRGQVVERPFAGAEAGWLVGLAGSALRQFVKCHRLGKAFAAGTGFVLARNPDTVRAPDVAFVTAERAAQQKRKEGYFEGPPDLAVEVVSPNDRDEEVEEKVLDFLEALPRMVIVVRPRTRTVTVYRSLSEIRVLTFNDTLDGGDVLPGFQVPVRELFD